MLKNYLKITWRNLIKNKVYSFINIGGLAVGMAVAILIGLWIYDEVSFNKNFTNYNSIAQIMMNGSDNGTILTQPAVSIPLADDIRSNFGSDVEQVALSSWTSSAIIAFGDKKFSKNGNFMEPSAQDLLSLKMLGGTTNALKEPNSILLSASLANILFGESNPIGQTVKLNNKTSVSVTGVYEDFPHNSNFRDVTFISTWALYASSEAWIKEASDNWDNNSFQIFTRINSNTRFQSVSAKIKDLVHNHAHDKATDKTTIFLYPMSEWHLYERFENGKAIGGSIQYVWLFGSIGFFVLLLACINFMNLSTARSEKRAKEVGIRKTIGSVKSQLIGQFLSESLTVVSVAFIFAIALIQINLPWFNTVTDKQITIPFANIFFWVICFSFIFFTGILAGSYPAFYLSSFKPVKVLKGTFHTARFASLPRKILVVTQFAVSVALIICTIIVFKQIQFAKNRPVGYNREGLITIPIKTPDLYGHYSSLRNELLKTGAVDNMCESASPATDIWSNDGSFEWRGKEAGNANTFGIMSCTPDFGKTIGWQLKDGRDFSKEFTDSSSLILNEAAVKLMNLKNPVGEKIKWGWRGRDYTVVGVVKDMIMSSPFEAPKPAIFWIGDDNTANIVTLKLKAGISLGSALTKVEAVFKNYNPGSPFEYSFVDEEYGKKFLTETRIGRLSIVFSVLAILISCLGIFGLALYVAEQRTKEIGVRKVLGASVLNVWALLSKEFIVLTVVSFFIASPIAYYFMNNWLDRYEYHTNISWWVFAGTGLGAMLITLFTVSFQAIKAAIANPVKSLRTE